MQNENCSVLENNDQASMISEQTEVATKWSILTEIGAKLVAPVTNIILARLLTPEAFGVVATVTMVVSFADIFTDAGFQKYLIQHDFVNQDELDRATNVAFWTNLVISCTVWVLIFAFSESIANMVGNPGLGNVISVAALSLPLTAFSSIQMARFKREFDFKTLFYIRMITASVPFVITIPLAFMLKNYWALVIGTLATNLLNACILTVKSTWKPHRFFKLSILKNMFSYSWWILLESIAVWLTSYVGTFIVGAWLSTYYVGIYKTSMSTVNQIINLVTAATSAPLFVALSRLKADDKAMLDTYYRFIRGLSLFIIPLGVGIWLYRDLVVDILLGKQWGEATNFVGLWGLTSSVSLLLGTYCNGLYNAKGKTFLSFLTQIIHIALLIPVLVWAAKQSYETTYIFRCLVRLQLVFVQMVVMKLCMNVNLCKLLRGLWPAVICTGVMSIVACGLRTIGDGLMWNMISIVLCIVAYFSTAMILYRKQLWDAIALFGAKSSRLNRR